MTGLEIAAAAAAIGGSALTAVGQIREGNFAEAAGIAQQKANERASDEVKAASQREAIRRSTEARVAVSRVQAVAAAGGGSATDPGVQRITGMMAREGAYQTGATLYEGAARGAALVDEGTLARAKGEEARLAGYIKAGSTALEGVSTMASKWAKLKPKVAASPATAPSAGLLTPTPYDWLKPW